MKNQILVIPAFDPTELLVKTIVDLDSNSYLRSLKKIIVDDGSVSGKFFFEKVQKFHNVSVIRHDVNKGKGAALKTAFCFILSSLSSVDTIVTLDSDFQHKAIDVLKVLEFCNNKSDVIFCIGARSFSFKAVPFRSYIGNRISQIVLWLSFKKLCADTQSGLRAYPFWLLKDIIVFKSNGYDFEMDVLLFLIKKNVVFFEVPIETIYIMGNQTSHYKPVRDSLKIIATLFRYKFKK